MEQHIACLWLFFVITLHVTLAKRTICVRQPSEIGVLIKGGMEAGNFVNLGTVRDINECLDRGCDSEEGNIAFLLTNTCFSVQCHNLQACALEYSRTAGKTTVGALYQVIAAYPNFKNAKDINNVPEDTPPGTGILNLKVTAESRKRQRETMTFEIVAGNEDKTFRLQPRSSTHRVKIHTTRSLDREQIPLYKFTLKASNKVENASTFLNITINVTDINDNPPKFVKSLFVFNVFSNMSIYSTVGRLIAIDKDIGENARLKYSISPNSDVITLNQNTGEVKLQTLLKLDTVKSHEYQVTVTDGVYSSNARLKVDVYPNNINRPKFKTHLYTISLNGQLPIGSEVIRVSASDPDFGKLGELTYVITKGNQDNVFSISNEGRITNIVDIPLQANSYNLTILVHDNGYPKLYALKQAHVIISLLWLRFNDAIYETAILENHRTSEKVASVSASLSVGGVMLMAGQRKRSNNAINYYLEDTRGMGVFEMEETTGIITLQKPLDYESQKFYEFVVKADYENTDSTWATTLLTANAIFRLHVMDVNDNAPIFFPLHYTQDVWRSSKINSPILKINATDKDGSKNGRIRYVAESGNFNNTFAFSSDGMIFLRKSLEEVAITVFNITIAAWDHGTPTPLRSVEPALVTIYVHGLTRGVLVFEKNSYNVAVWENEPARTRILRVRASNAEKSKIAYSMGETDHDLPFRVDNTGWIINTERLDREKKKYYVLKIVASTDLDRVSLTTFAHVTVNLKDKNDNHPKFTQTDYSAIVASHHVGTQVLRVHAKDDDDQMNARIVYKISGGKNQDYFAIDSSTGQITTKRLLPTESLIVLKFFVSARDEGRPSLTSQKPVPVFVLVSSTFPISVISLERTATTIKLQFTMVNVTLQDLDYIGVVVQEIGSIAEYDKVTRRPLASWFYVHNMKGTGIYAQRYLTGKVDCTDKIKESKTFMFTVGTDGDKCFEDKKIFCNGKLQAEKKYRFQLVAFFKNGTSTKNISSVESQLSEAIKTEVTSSEQYAGFRSWRYDIIVIILGVILGLIIIGTITRAIILYKRDKERMKNEETKDGISYPLSNPRYHRTDHSASSRSTISFTVISKSKKGERRSEKTTPCETDEEQEEGSDTEMETVLN